MVNSKFDLEEDAALGFRPGQQRARRIALWSLASVLPIACSASAAHFAWRSYVPRFSLQADDSRCPHGMALIPAGTFVHQKKENDPDFFGPAVPPTHVGAFCLDQNEVTVEAYESCVRRGLCTSPDYLPPRDQNVDLSQCNYGHSLRRHHPMNCVSFDEAASFCAANSKRLPSKWAWEYAAEHGSDRNTYPSGVDPSGIEPPVENVRCWSGDRSWWTGQPIKRHGTCPVRSFAAGPFGLFDLDGNVREMVTFSEMGSGWDQAWVGGHFSQDTTFPTRDLRSDFWSTLGPDGDPSLGFRCAADVVGDRRGGS